MLSGGLFRLRSESFWPDLKVLDGFLISGVSCSSSKFLVSDTTSAVFLGLPHSFYCKWVLGATFQVPGGDFLILLLEFFLCGPFLKSLLNLLQHCFCFMFWFFWLRGMWDLNSPTRDWTQTPFTGRQILNHWTTRKVQVGGLILKIMSITIL